MILDDRFARTVRLFVKYNGGQWLLDSGRPLPEIREGALGELILSPYAIVDEEACRALTQERRVPFFEKGSSLWVCVDSVGVPEKLRSAVKGLPSWPPQDRTVFVEIVLKEDLYLILRPNKDARLDDCVCSIPSLPTAEAKSVNHAYTLVSTAFEPKRRSHSGNVFRKVYYASKLRDRNCLRALNDRRMGVEIDCASDAMGSKTARRPNERP